MDKPRFRLTGRTFYAPGIFGLHEGPLMDVKASLYDPVKWVCVLSFGFKAYELERVN